MAREIKYNPEPQCIFREPFLSLWDIKNNPYGRGTPSATGITYNGDGTISLAGNTSGIIYKKALKGTYTFRFVFRSFTPNVTNGVLFQADTASYYISQHGVTPNLLIYSSGTAYVNGSASSTISTDTKEIVVSGISVTTAIMYMLYNRFTSQGAICTLDLVEIYKGTLSASQVVNLYNKKTYIEVPSSVSEQLGSLMNVSFCVNSNYTTFDGASSTGFHAISNGGASHYCGTVDELSITSGNSYRITFTGVLTGTAPSFALADALGGTIRSNIGTLAVGSNSVVLTATATTTAVLQWYNASTVTEFTVSNLSVKNITVPSITTLLKYDSLLGSSRDRTGQRTLTDTSMTYVKNAKGLGMAKFDGSASKISLGATTITNQTLLFSAWINSKYPTTGFVFGNGAFGVWCRNADFYFSRNFSSTPLLTYPNIVKNKWIFIALITEGSGTYRYAGFYGDFNTPLYKLTSGTHAAPTVGSNDVIGFGDSKYFQGFLPMIRISAMGSYDEVYALQRLTQIFTQSKGYFQ